MDAKEVEKRLAFEEFQLLYESAERVSDRRISGNRWNYSICTAVMVATALVLQWAVTHPDFLAAGALVTAILCALAVFFCELWLAEIQSFKDLNSAKFKVLSEMAPDLAFGPPDEDSRSSCSPFDREWEIMESLNAIKKLGNRDTKALRSSSAELLLPRIFQALFILIIVVVVIAVILNWDVFVQSLSFEIATSE